MASTRRYGIFMGGNPEQTDKRHDAWIDAANGTSSAWTAPGDPAAQDFLKAETTGD